MLVGFELRSIGCMCGKKRTHEPIGQVCLRAAAEFVKSM